MTDPRRQLPSVNALLQATELQPLLDRAPRRSVTEAVRAALDRVRREHRPLPTTLDEWSALVRDELDELDARSLVPVLNATGVVLHTNLGRAPLAAAAITAIADIAGGASNLEYDLATGTRGSRHAHCVRLLSELTGAEDAIVVNNCAAALVLALNTCCDGREAIVSRGELIEIGGSFRVPDILTRSGASLREVGTTNRTHVDDYRRALGPQTGALLKVHRSNFSQVGFVAQASVRDLAPVAAEAAVPLLHDFGSGLMLSLEPWGLRGEPTARDCVAEGATLVAMSGDKLLGGPQAGLLLGTREAIAECRRNPLARAVRVDKLTLAALEATLRLYRDPARAVREVPVLRMLTTPVAELRERADRVVKRLDDQGAHLTWRETEATVGGGAFPTARIPSVALMVAADAAALEERLRTGALPVVGRIENQSLLLDLRTVPEERDDDLMAAILSAGRGGPTGPQS
jgi:L-seryl-tRNA(Ser) seleniumtransferase